MCAVFYYIAGTALQNVSRRQLLAQAHVDGWSHLSLYAFCGACPSTMAASSSGIWAGRFVHVCTCLASSDRAVGASLQFWCGVCVAVFGTRCGCGCGFPVRRNKVVLHHIVCVGAYRAGLCVITGVFACQSLLGEPQCIAHSLCLHYYTTSTDGCGCCILGMQAQLALASL